MLEEAVSLENWVQADRMEAGDEKLLVRFYLRPVQNTLKTEGGELPIQGPNDLKLKRLQADAEAKGYKVETDFSDPRNKRAIVTGAGRPIFDDVEYVEIRIPDKIDKYNQQDRPAKKRDRIRFRRQYEAFKAANAEASSGTPLSRWPLITATQVEEFRYLKIDGEPHPVRTVEELADFPDEFLPYLGSLSSLKKKAADYISHAKGQAPMLQMRAELDRRDSEMAELRRMLDQQSQLIQGLTPRHIPTGPVEVVPAHAPIPVVETLMQPPIRAVNTPEAAQRKRGPGRPKKQVEE